LSAYTNLTNVEKLKDLVENLIEDFKDFEKNLGMQKFLVKRGCQRVDDFEKEHVCVSLKLKDVTIQLEVLEFQISCNVLWAKCLAKQLTLCPMGPMSRLFHCL
jgi:plasmid rolling circle replication initiator protein Rep